MLGLKLNHVSKRGPRWRLHDGGWAPLTWDVLIDSSHKSHNAPENYPTIHHFINEICTRVHISVTNWCIKVWDRLIVGFVSQVYYLRSIVVGVRDCPACRTSLIATRFWVVVICPIIKCVTVLEFSFILFDLCLFITNFNFVLNYVPIATFWIFTYHKVWILLIIFCFIWSYWIIYFLTCLEVFWSVVS